MSKNISPDDTKCDEVLKKMLQTPPTPHKKNQAQKEGNKDGRPEGDIKKD